MMGEVIEKLDWEKMLNRPPVWDDIGRSRSPHYSEEPPDSNAIEALLRKEATRVWNEIAVKTLKHSPWSGSIPEGVFPKDL